MVDFLLLMKTLYIFAAVLNGTGLFLMVKKSNTKMDFTQRCIITNLCISDLCVSISLVIYLFQLSNAKLSNVVETLVDTFRFAFYFATLWLVFDRYLHMKLLIRYALYWSAKKTVFISLMLWSFSVLGGILWNKYWMYSGISVWVLYGVMDLAIILFSAFVYAYALALLIKQTKKLRSNRTNGSISKGLSISLFIILSHIVLVAVPNLLQIIPNNKNFSEGVKWYMRLCFPICLWTDALIYIYVSPQVRKSLRNKIKTMRQLVINRYQNLTETITNRNHISTNSETYFDKW